MLKRNSDFDEWYRTMHPQMVAVVVSSFGDPHLGTDAADEACVRACERWSTVREMSSPNGWAIRVALNVARRKQRRRAMERRLLGSPPPRDVDGPAGELWLVVAALPVRQREAVALRHVAQLTEAEIAEIMGITRGGVSSTLRAAYSALKVTLTEDEGVPTDA